MFVIDKDMKLWEIIKNGPKVPMKKDADKRSYNQTHLEAISKNFRLMNQLCCALNGIEFNRISSCVTAKEI